MTTPEQIEARLLRAVGSAPTEDGWRWLDQRVGQVMAVPAARHQRGDLRIRRTFLRALVVLAAFVLLTGAVAAALGLLDRTIHSSGAPGWQTAWDRAERLGLKQTDAGITITLERAYADLNQVLVGFTVEGLQPAPMSSSGERKVAWVAELRDPIGRTDDQWAPSGLGSGGAETTLSAVVQTWQGAVSPVGGTWELTIESVGYTSAGTPDSAGTPASSGLVSGECYASSSDPACVSPPANAMIDGTWRFEFTLPTPAGTVVAPNVSDMADTATLTLSELRITPTVIRARIGLRVDGVAVVEWTSLHGSVRHGGTSYTFNSSYHVTQDPQAQGPNGDVNEFMALAGSDEAAGTWEIEIPELDYSTAIDGDQTHVTGPWTLTVAVP